MTKCKMANYVSNCQYTHYQNITCLTLLSWLLTSYMIDYIKYNIIQNALIAAYGEIHMHTPPKVFIQLWIKTTQLGKIKPGVNVN